MPVKKCSRNFLSTGEYKFEMIIFLLDPVFKLMFTCNYYCIIKNADTSYISLNYDESGVHAWELYLLTRRRTVQFLNQATITLKVNVN
jgi:hypothetical protein